MSKLTELRQKAEQVATGSAKRGAQRLWLPLVAVAAVIALVAVSCGGGSGAGSDIAKERKLSQADQDAALMTYTPSGRHDPYIMLASGGHSGQLFVVGIPSMRILRSIGVFTPEAWAGWGFGNKVTDEVLAEGDWQGKPIRWGDTHHPSISETNGEYDGEFIFINDKANAREAVVNLKDFETKQIIKNPLTLSDHGGSFVTPDTEWVVEGGQYATPLGFKYGPVEQYRELYRGMITMWKFDRQAGRIDPSKSFAMELPPYWQDLCDSGKKVSDGWIFCNSFNTETANGGDLPKAQGGPGGEPFEKSTTVHEMDYLHVINLKKAAEVAAAGKTVNIGGFPVIPLETTNQEGLLYFVPEPKSPHGSDVHPSGEFIVVAGKLDPHVTIYSFKKIMKAIEDKKFKEDPYGPYGVPVIDFDSAKEAQVEIGLGPLHTQFDNKGYAYTSLFLDSAVARWSFGGKYAPKDDKPWALIQKTKVQYNIGHLATAEGDTVSPDGNWLVALNKWSLDRFFPTGPLLPQNFQLLDISKGGKDMPVLYDMPMGIGEPHYAQIIKADKLKPFKVYPGVGFDPGTMAIDPTAPKQGQEKITRNGNNVTIDMTAIRSHFTPDRVELKAGDNVTWRITNLEQAQDATHGFNIPGYNINVSLEPGETATVQFVADRSGVFPFYCLEFCSALHLEMAGYMTVQ